MHHRRPVRKFRCHENIDWNFRPTICLDWLKIFIPKVGLTVFAFSLHLGIFVSPVFPQIHFGDLIPTVTELHGDRLTSVQH